MSAANAVTLRIGVANFYSPLPIPYSLKYLYLNAFPILFQLGYPVYPIQAEYFSKIFRKSFKKFLTLNEK